MSLVIDEDVIEEESLAAVIEAARGATADIALITDATQTIVHVSAAFTAMTGYEPADLLGRTCRDLQGPGTDVGTRRRMREVLASGQVFEGQILNYRKDGSAFWTALRIIPIEMSAGHGVTHYVSVQQDISNRVALLEQLQHQALHDPVTGLPNRTAAEQSVEDAIRSARRDVTVAVGLIDLDDFRLINNTLGHAAGDSVLQQWAMRVLSHLRDGDVLARMGGDEFLLILRNVTRNTAREELPVSLARIHQAVEKPFDVDGQQVRIGMSLGITLIPEGGTDSRSLLRCADEALYEIKERRRSRTTWWRTVAHTTTGSEHDGHENGDSESTVHSTREPTSGSTGRSGSSNAEDYRSALTAENVVVHLQPVVDLRDGTVHLFEALTRLRLPQGRIAYPADFLPQLTVENETLLFAIVLDKALEILAAWDRKGIRHHVSVNLPPAVLLEDGTSALVQELLHTHGIEPARLGLELLESDITDLELQRNALGELVEIGVGLAMDDLGSGHSSLQRLSSFPFNAIKLDRGLLLHARDKPLETLSLMATLIQLGRDLGKNVVIEGLEDESLTEAATVLGAPLGQGYHFAKPMPPADSLRWSESFSLRSHRSPIQTPLGALAYHWQFARLAAPHPLDLDRCPLTRFIASEDESENVRDWHARQHGPTGMHPASSRFLIDWLTAHIRNYASPEC